jgi:hypothetical protein
MADLGQASDRDGNDVIIAVATRIVPSSGATCSALARAGLGPAARVPVCLRHQVAELASSRVALRE